MTYRRARNLKEVIAPNPVEPPTQLQIFPDMKGYYPCGTCKVCKGAKTQRTNRFASTTTGKEYKIRSFITCHTVGVIYLITCQCGMQYVGRTVRTGCKRIGEHLSNIRKGFTEHSLSQHCTIHHHKDPSQLKVTIIEKFVPHWRGSDLKRTISRRETFWIYELRCFRPKGHNVEWDINAFINNS